ncbi:bacteriohemerythrin [Thiothrix fructosivorans]|uniref:Hemerythrin family protein n=1 Tax=Thiothrix fructosivorans TaxID=111770 RepID=A0A8B0SPU9_9GAMM|nr:hemerythrin family protein [Thiothrix fructosivorans]MBO0611462.1 hemerythrin family protein [Thiothrix fructosivorans]QTX12979.1 hemerythrin family protein [Thiothrix fructosivorans]
MAYTEPYSVDWDALPNVAMPFMNTVHSDELALVTRLLASLNNAAAPASIDAQISAWVEHTQVHFAREEHLMQEYNFFAAPCHQGEHEQALLQLLGVQQQWLRERDTAALLDYIQHWREWLQQHISTMDFVTAQFLSSFNIQVEL